MKEEKEINLIEHELKKFIFEKFKSQKELAKKLNMTEAQLSRLLKKPNEKFLVKLGRAMNAKIEVFNNRLYNNSASSEGSIINHHTSEIDAVSINHLLAINESFKLLLDEKDKMIQELKKKVDQLNALIARKKK